MKGEVAEHFNITEASKMIVIVVFVGVPIASLFNVYPKSLLSLALLMLHHHHRRQALHHPHHYHGNFDVEDQETQEDTGLGVVETGCVVCLCPVSPDDEFRVLSCDHGFHDHCIETWLQSCSTCPLCRTPVTDFYPSSERHQQQQHFYDAVLSCFFSQLFVTPNSELMSAFIENSNNSRP
ncbi:putative RING-H2 finger protein ATL49 [Rhododendron vialii]|uniref:putative RING-H2 finger protein ATL49 n=1 Tax=Rhododendron vialii TaxID=182163 RepID=UPI00265EF7A8|nr:putative RING-H2 finger protein ATL49 [Rhododendron vialii]